MELGVDYTIRLLDESDRVDRFSTGNPAFQPLKSFLQNQASDFQTGNIAKTYVAVKLEPRPDATFAEVAEPAVLGYMTLTCSEIKLGDGYSIEDCPYASNYESLPAVKIARLAMDKSCRKSGVGKEFVALAIALATDVIAPAIGCRFVVTDAKSQAVEFYLKVGFTILDTEANKQQENPVMFVDLLNIEDCIDSSYASNETTPL